MRCKDLDLVCGLPRGTAFRLLRRVRSAIARCTIESARGYRCYGGRGIRVHPPWIEHPKLFVVYLSTLDGCDDPELWIDRVDNDGHYAPGNLRFVSPVDSTNNQRKRRHKHVGANCTGIRG